MNKMMFLVMFSFMSYKRDIYVFHSCWGFFGVFESDSGVGLLPV